MLSRRTLLLAAPALAQGLPLRAAAQPLPPAHIVFPLDHGSHPDFRTEWWYITGRATAGTREFGFQVTFFRSRVDAAQPLQSRFAARQLVFAHAALTDVQGGRLLHDQRIAREGFGVAQAGLADADVHIRDWHLQRAADGRWQARVDAGDFALDLQFEPTQPVLLQGQEGLSRKGPDAAQASYYYSLPQLATRGQLRLRGERFPVTAGRAWMDHEWSRELLHPQAVGWDWIGMNLDDGGALTAFRLRTAQGDALWSGGSFRAASGSVRNFAPGELEFSPQRSWTSPRTGTRYPVAWQLRTPQGPFAVKAVVDDQELDSRGSTGSVYWEGLSGLWDGQDRRVGWGYLEMTGYGQRLQL
ncbi:MULTISPECIES: carotenoid 1,2-hydratase [Ramlibacter]|uniref:Carotenoid 1,2-hydratase n=1 Tax=Ramlibacter aquaticus TaxID=2780094 RepID=A0ABR9SG49_9BURK|nr:MULTISPECIES: carotenoid 1,2-hydratase [Ramlibacter]MBE7940742.1 carotenoid 1,2-hydratase [Ramlibacter aquaticus]